MIHIEDNATEDELMEAIKAHLIASPQLFPKGGTDKPKHGGAVCFMRALRLGEPTFTLRAQDRTATDTVDFWVHKNPQLSEERYEQTLERINEMNRWPTKKAAS